MLQTNILASLSSEGFNSRIIRTVDTVAGTENVNFRADGDIDGDGANGQHGLPASYLVNNQGRDILADVGYPRIPDEYSQGLICRPGTRTPVIFPGGIYGSRTAYRMVQADGFTPYPQDDLRVGVDAEFFPYIVVPPCCKTGTLRKILGSRVLVINHKNGLSWVALVADIGPTKKDGEISPFLARKLGIPDSPRTGGIDTPDLEYQINVGVPALVIAFDGKPYTFPCQ